MDLKKQLIALGEIRKERNKIYKVTRKLIETNFSKKSMKNLEKAIASANIEEKTVIKIETLCKKNGIKIITPLDQEYPQELKILDSPPPVLYVKGREWSNELIAIVGSRKASPYGVHLAQLFAYKLSLKGIGIISGFAVGIDRYAHIGALRAEGVNIAVLGCGILVEYPKENLLLRRKMRQQSTFLSEFPLFYPPYRHNFPLRNRVIAALAKAVLVVEANERSGALITANYALELGKDIFAIPGRITDKQAKGVNRLIQEGAYLVSSVDDILEYMGYIRNSRTTSKTTSSLKKNSEDLDIINALYGET